MFKCRECAEKTAFSNAHTFLAHLQYYHPSVQNGSMFKCYYIDCFREFDNFNSFRKHTLGCHRTYDAPLPLAKSEAKKITDEYADCLTADSPSVSTPPEDSVILSLAAESECLKYDEALANAIVTYIANLYSAGLTETQVQLIIESHMQLLNGTFLSILKDSINSLLSKAKEISDIEKTNVAHMFESLINMFNGFQTTHLRITEFTNCGAFVKPDAFITGTGVTEKYIDGEVVLEPISLTGQIIKFRYILKGFLELAGVLRTILDFIDGLESDSSGEVQNIIQGSLWRQKIKPLFDGKIVLPITFYFDDYETNKELGSHTGVHTVGAGYVRLPCLPPQYQSTLVNIFLVLLFHSADKAFGNKAIFQKLVDEFSFLETEGITVVIDGVTQRLYFALCFVGGDNKGANEILGYVRSFSAHYYCRICCQIKCLMSKKCILDRTKLRTPEMYEQELRINDQSKTGTSSTCVFNTLKSFHVYQNFHVDIMHDWDEGVWKYVMTDVVKYFVSSGRCTLMYLNELVQGFFYGPNELRNKPPLILESHLKKDKLLKFSASEMRCFVRYFGLLAGHLVTYSEKDRAVWQLYLTTRKIADIITAPKCLPSDHQELTNF